MTTNQAPRNSQQPQPTGTALGFALGIRLRIICAIPGFALMIVGCFSGVRDGPNYVAVTALVLGFALFAAGIVGRFPRLTYQAPTGPKLEYGFDHPTSAPRESPPEQAAPPPPAPEEPDLGRAEIEVLDQGVGTDTVQVEKREPFGEAFTALQAKDYSTFDSKLQEAIEAETDNDRKAAFDSFRLQELYAAGQTQRLEELRALRDKYPTSHFPVMRLGDCYDSTGEYEKAAAVYSEGYEITALTGEQRVTLLSRQAQALRKAKLFEKAENCLAEGLERAKSDGERAEVEKLLAALYEDWGKQDEMLLHLEKALELNPGDVDARFTLAYRYGKAGYKLAAFYHYRILRRDASVLNNLAVILSELDMPITTAKFYRSAWEQKETLAAGNLAGLMAEAGLVDEAKEVLAEARKEEDVNQRVYQVSLNVARWEENEKERLKQIGEAGKAERSLVLKRFELERQQLSSLRVEDIEGTWRTGVGDMTFQRRGDKLLARFKDDIWDWELTGQVSQRIYSFTWKCDRRSQNQQGDGFFLFPTDSEFEGIIRHTPAKGEASLVNGGERRPPPAPGQAPGTSFLEEFLPRRLPPS